MLKMTDEKGADEKIIAVPSAGLTRRYANRHNDTDLPSITLEQILHFFAHDTDLEPGQWAKVQGCGDAAEAEALIRAAIKREQNSRSD